MMQHQRAEARKKLRDREQENEAIVHVQTE